jgi:hypothetical protein
MARYDGGFGRGGAEYDREAAAREAYTPGGFGPEWQRRERGGGYDGDFRPPHRLGGGEGAPWTEQTMNGPARYGLGPYHRRLEQRRRPDEELKHDVEEALFYDTWVDSEAITVEVRDGVVALRGELPDHDEVRYATDDAWDVEGVRGVRCELRVNSARRKPLDRTGRAAASGHEAGNG